MIQSINAKIYLSGGGDENQSQPFDNFFFSELKPSAKLLYIPIALRNYPIFSPAGHWMEKVLALHNRAKIELNILENFDDPLAQSLDEYDAIYIGGGNTWSLMKEIKDSGFDDRLKKYLETDKLYYGGSAGAIIMGKFISPQQDPNEVAMEDAKGLDVLSTFSIGCHYKDSEIQFYKNWAKANQSKLLLLTEESGVIFDQGYFKPIGKYIVLNEQGEITK